jgi:hypothetical protein
LRIGAEGIWTELAHAAHFRTIIAQNKIGPWSQKISDHPGIQRHDSASNSASRMPTFAARGGLTGKPLVWATPSGQAESTWQIPFRAISPTKTRTKTDSALPLPSPNSRPMDMGSMTWPETFGSGSQTGTAPTTIGKSPPPVQSAATLLALTTPSILTSVAYQAGHARRILSVHRSILLPLHGRNSR